MRSFQQKRGWKNIMQSRPVLMFLAALLLFFAWGVVSFMGKMELARENKKTAEEKALELEDKKEKLLSDIAKLKTQSGIEENIRLKFGLAKEGEDVIVVIEDKNTLESPKQEKEGFFSFLKDWFK